MSDPTAAERARRYRARRRASTQHGAATLAELLEVLIEEVHNLRDSVDNLGHRDASRGDRDVTERHAPLNGTGALAGAEYDAGTHPSGASTGVPRDAAVTALTVAALHGRILEALARAPASVAALADALDLGQRPTLEALVELSRMDLVRRIPGETARDRDRWERIPSPLIEALDLGLDPAEMYA